ncbi:hypothetical protein [Weissella bombi]|uniref:hypothetical protein n=1 Tax=Weissella bombi TaxID=1505725 RepID=UPI003AF27DF7
MKTVDTDLVEIKGDELFGAKEFLAQLQNIKAFDVTTNTELAQAKKQRAVVAKVKPFIKKLHKQYQTEKEAEFRMNNPEFALIEELTNDLLQDFDDEIKPYVASIKEQRLQRIQPMIDEIAGNYNVDTYTAPTEYANEEYWTQTNNPASKLDKKIVDDVRIREFEKRKQLAETAIDHRKDKKLKNTIKSIIDSIDRTALYDGNDVIKLLIPLGEFIKKDN